MRYKKKKALSPVLASVLLVSISLVIAVIIFFWARSFLSEQIMKNERDVGLECEDVRFRAEAFAQGNEIKFRAENTATVPIYGFEIRKRQLIGEIRIVEVLNKLILSGQTTEFTLPAEIQAGDEITTVPILLGETDKYKKAFVCDDSLSQTFTVSTS